MTRLRAMRPGYNIAPSPSAERLADGVVQTANVVLAGAGCVVLGVLAGTHADPRRLAALTVYGAGLLAMVGSSALHAWARGGRRHRLYRHLDHAAIFLMIAGTVGDDVGSFQKIQILLAEYGSLRSEIIARTTVGYQLVGIGFTGGGIVLLQHNVWLLALCLGIGAVLLAFGGWFVVRDILKLSARLREIEADVNMRAGEALLEWETRYGAPKTGWFGASRPLPRTS